MEITEIEFKQEIGVHSKNSFCFDATLKYIEDDQEKEKSVVIKIGNVPSVNIPKHLHVGHGSLESQGQQLRFIIMNKIPGKTVEVTKKTLSSIKFDALALNVVNSLETDYWNQHKTHSDPNLDNFIFNEQTGHVVAIDPADKNKMNYNINLEGLDLTDKKNMNIHFVHGKKN